MNQPWTMKVVGSIDELQRFLTASNVALDKRLTNEQADSKSAINTIFQVTLQSAADSLHPKTAGPKLHD